MNHKSKYYKETNFYYNILQKLPNNYGDALAYLMKNLKIKEADLAREAYLTPITISRHRNYGTSRGIKIEQVLQIIVGMKLSYIVSDQLLRTAGFILTNSQEHLFIKKLLIYDYDKGVEYLNEQYLIAFGKQLFEFRSYK